MRLDQRPHQLYHCVAATLAHKADLTAESAVRPNGTEKWPVGQKLNVPEQARHKKDIQRLACHLC